MDSVIETISEQTEVPVSSLPDVPRPVRKYPRFFFVLILFVVVGLIGVGWYVQGVKQKDTARENAVTASQATPTPDQTATWKAYANKKNKYSLKYPLSFTVYENLMPSVDGVLTTSSNTASLIGGDYDNFNMIIITDSKKYSDFTKAIGSKPACEGKMPKADQYVLGGVKGEIFKDTLCGPIGETQIYVLKDATLYTIHIISREVYEKSAASVDQILSTFKFVQ